MNKELLLELADILDRADAEHEARGEPGYDQERFAHSCGTAACALGHWAAAHPERWSINPTRLTLHSRTCADALEGAKIEFGLAPSQVYVLFDSDGCGGAKTAKQAADYIRAFVARDGAA